MGIHDAGKRAALAPQVLALRAEGLKHREIAERLGISRSYAADICIDPDGARIAARRQSYAGTCEDCGAPTNGSDGPAKAATVCGSCNGFRQRYWTRERIIEAIQEWARLHDGFPPLATDWLYRERSGDFKHPSMQSIFKSKGNEHAPFDSWADAIEAAGFRRPRRGDKTTKWRREGMTDEQGKTVLEREYLIIKVEAPGTRQILGETVLAHDTTSALEAADVGEGVFEVIQVGALQRFTRRTKLVSERARRT